MFIYCLPINPFWTSTETILLPFVSDSRQKLVQSYRFSIDQKLSLYAALLTRMGLCILTGIPAPELSFYSKQFHKPYLLSAPQYHFNFSHTRNFIICCISSVCPVGVDVEKIITAPLDLMEQLFHVSEKEYVYNSTSNFHLNCRFFKIWTQKESYVKCLGTGLSESLASINLLEPKFTPNYYNWKQDSYACSVYTAQPDTSTIITLTETDVQNYFLLEKWK